MLGMKIPFGVNGAPFRKGLADMRKETDKWGGDIKGTIKGALGFAAVSVAVSSYIKGLKEAKAASLKLNTSFAETQKLMHSANLAGVEFEEVGEFISNARERVLEFNEGSKSTIEFFKQMGIDMNKFAGASARSQLLQLSKAYKESSDKVTFVSAGIGLLGDEMKRVLPLLKEGPAELEKGMEQASITTERQLAQIKKFEQSLVKMKNVAVAGFNKISTLFTSSFTLIGGVLGGLSRAVLENFGAWGRAWESIKGSFTLDWSKMTEGLSDAWDHIVSAFTNPISAVKEAWSEAVKEIRKQWEDATPKVAKKIDQEKLNKTLNHFGVKTEEVKKGDNKAKLKLMKEQEEAAKKLAKLEADMLPIQDKLKAKKEELFKLYEKNSSRSLDKEDPKSELRALELEKEISDLKKKQKSKDDKITAQITAQRDRKAESDASVVEAQRESDFNKADKKGKIKFLEEDLLKNESALKNEKDPLKKNELKKKRIATSDKLRELKKEEEPEKVSNKTDNSSQTIIANSLASIGGGGGVGVSVSDPVLQEARRRNQLAQITNAKLDGIANAIRNQGGGEKPTTFREE